jgi:hypothetical protein
VEKKINRQLCEWAQQYKIPGWTEDPAEMKKQTFQRAMCKSIAYQYIDLGGQIEMNRAIRTWEFQNKRTAGGVNFQSHKFNNN